MLPPLKKIFPDTGHKIESERERESSDAASTGGQADGLEVAEATVETQAECHSKGFRAESERKKNELMPVAADSGSM